MFKQILLILDDSSPIPKVISLINKLTGIHSHLTAVYIIDSNWRNILGDEWISNAGLRSIFFRYMEEEQHEHARQTLAEVMQKTAAMNLQVNTLIKTGKPHQMILAAYNDFGPFDLVILPHSARKSVKGTIKINVSKITQVLLCPILMP